MQPVQDSHICMCGGANTSVQYRNASLGCTSHDLRTSTSQPAWLDGRICQTPCLWLDTACSSAAPSMMLCARLGTPPWVLASAAAAHTADPSILSQSGPEGSKTWTAIDDVMTDTSVARIASVSPLYDSSLWRWAKRSLHRSQAASLRRLASQVRLSDHVS